MNHDGETLDQAKARFIYGLRHPFTRNPAARNRMGWYDTIWGHSTTNLYVTYCREEPRNAGHVWRYSVIGLLVLLLLALIARRIT
jgi:hypothetical protein